MRKKRRGNTFLEGLGDLIYLGKSIGYGLPYSVQFTNPEREVFRASQGGHGTMPQADPSGLFVPDGLSATWVRLYNPADEKTHTVYIEPQIIVSPFKLHPEKVGSMQHMIEAGNGEAPAGG